MECEGKTSLLVECGDQQIVAYWPNLAGHLSLELSHLYSAPGKSGLHARGEGEGVIALLS